MAKYTIEFKLEKDGRAEVNLDGNNHDLLIGTLMMVIGIRQSMQSTYGEDEAKWFLEQLGKALIDPEHPLYEEVRK